MTTGEIWTTCIAIYGAIVATMVLGWDLFKWAVAGPRLNVQCQAGMVMAGTPGNQKMILITVANRGDSATTITNLGGLCYKTWWDAHRPWKRKAAKAFIVYAPSQAQPLPFVVQPGVQWMGLADQDPEIEAMMTGSHLYFVVYHAHSDKGIRRRLRLRTIETTPSPPAAQIS